jgi:hypothetical protein
MKHQDLVVVDVQPCYRDSVASNMLRALVAEIQGRLAAGGTVWMLYNNEELSGDRIEFIHEFWLGNGLTEDDIESCRWVEKTYAFLRGWMDCGVASDEIVGALKELHRLRVGDSRDLDETFLQGLSPEGAHLGNPLFDSPELQDSGLGLLQQVETCGGGRDECLAEVELWLSSRGVCAERLHHLTY